MVCYKYLNNDIEFSLTHNMNATDNYQRLIQRLNRDDRIFLFFSLFIAIVTFYYASSIYKDSVDLMYGHLRMALGFMMILNVIVYPFHRRRKVATYGLATLAGGVILSSAIQGGSHGTGLFYAFGFPLATFFFVGLRQGIIINLTFISSLLLVTVLTHFGIINSFYSSVQLLDGVIASVLVFLLGFFAQESREKLMSKAQGQKQQLQALLQNLPVGVILVDAKTREVAIKNTFAEQLFGREIGLKLHINEMSDKLRLSDSTGRPYETEKLPIAVALNNKSSIVVQDIFTLRPDGSKIVLRSSASPINDSDGKVMGAVAVFEDISREFEVSQMKTELVSLASHQIKSPLTAIRWSIETLLDESEGSLQEDQRNAILEIQEIVSRLTMLVKDLLNVSRIETGRKFEIKRKQVDVVPLLKSVMKEQESIAKKSDVSLDVSKLPAERIMYVDPDKFSELFMNLVGNAVKYSKSGGEVQVGMEVGSDEGDILYVRDNGIGIPAGEQKKIFSRFYRASNSQTHAEGTGLGLYIAKVIAERHDGNLWFESQEGKGTTFFLELH